MFVLVTGAAGFLGAHIVRSLLRNGDDVRALVRPGRPRNHIRKLGVELREGDIQDEEGMAQACQGVAAVIHCASLISYWGRQNARLREVNVDGPMVLLEAASDAGVESFVHVSSAGAVGSTVNGELLTENTPWDHEALTIPYLRSKHEGEQRVLAAAWGGMPTLVINPSMMLGPHLDGLPPSPLITGIMRGKLPWIPPGGISVTDVTDVAEATVRAITSGRSGERYLLAGHNVTWEQLYQAIADNADGRLPTKKLSPRRLAWLTRFASFKDRLRLTRPPWTPELYRSYGSFAWFDSTKAERELQYEVRPLARIVRHSVRREAP